MPKKFIWLALLMGGLPMIVFYIIDIVFKLHLNRNHPALLTIINCCLLFITGSVFYWQFLKWIKETRRSYRMRKRWAKLL